jgi:hypothetical protein
LALFESEVYTVDYIGARQAAQQWGISDRRVRMLCAQGKVTGAMKDRKSYRIPADAAKPHDGRARKGKQDVGAAPTRYLKWGDALIGLIHADNSVLFLQPAYNQTVALYTRGASNWSPEQFTEFLSERIVNRERRDIERILFRCGLSHYDVQLIAQVTRGIHPKDLLWIADTQDERFESVLTGVFDSVFHQRIDLVGESLDTPEGYNVKRYGVFRGRYGIFKQRISPLVTDVESEVAVYLLAQRLGVPCCPAVRVEEDTVFSTFLYDFSKEYLVHFRRLFEGKRSDNEYRNLVTVRPSYRKEIAQMILLDFITRQDDRHLSNIAIKVSANGESFYPLFDNGRSLFYEDTEQTVLLAVADIATWATSFGYVGSYWDYVQEIALERGGLAGLLRLDITQTEVAALLKEAGFTGYRLDGAREWILKALEMVRALERWSALGRC